MVVAARAGGASTGILGLPTLLLLSSYIKYKSNKTSSNRRHFGEVGNRSRSLRFSCFHIDPSCGELLPDSAETIVTADPSQFFPPVSHSFHKHSTARREEERPEEWKSRWKLRFTRPIARLVY